MPGFPQRVALTCLLAIMLAATAGCGFQPRGQASDFAGIPAPVMISGINRYTELYRELASQLEIAGIATTVNRADSATVLRIIEQDREVRVLTVDSRNRRVENEIEESVRFEVLDNDDRVVAAPQTVRVVRIQFRPPTDILASRREADLLREDMRRELAQRILQRVAAQR